MELLASDIPLTTPRTLQAVTNALRHLPELHSKNLLLKSPYVGVTGWNPVGPQVEASSWLAGSDSAGRGSSHYWRREASSLLASFDSVGRGSSHYWNRKRITSLTQLRVPTSTMTGLSWHARWYKSSTSILRATNHFVLGLKAHFTPGSIPRTQYLCYTGLRPSRKTFYLLLLILVILILFIITITLLKMDIVLNWLPMPYRFIQSLVHLSPAIEEASFCNKHNSSRSRQ